MEDLQVLRNEIAQYSTIDDQIKRLNKELTAARNERYMFETRITRLLATPQFIGYQRLSVSNDNSVIKIKRPQQWEKPWSLSRSGLRDLLQEYFQSTNEPTAEQCYDFITNRNRKMSTEYFLERVVSE